MIRILLLFCFRHCRIRSTSMTNEAIYIYVWKNPCAILSRKKIIVNCLFRLLVVSAHAHRLIPGIYSNTIKLTKRKKEMNNSNANSRTLILINEIQIRIQKEIRNWRFFDTMSKIFEGIEIFSFGKRFWSRDWNDSNSNPSKFSNDRHSEWFYSYSFKKKDLVDISIVFDCSCILFSLQHVNVVLLYKKI
jgi:hypothetical protein